MTQRSGRSGRATSSGSRTRRSRPPRQRVSGRKIVKTFFALLLLLLETVVAIALFFAFVWFKNFSAQLPNVEDLAVATSAPTATTIWSEDGVQLGKLEVENREPVTLDEVPKHLVDATVSIEDHRFFEHPGIDIWGIARAAYADLRRNNLTSQGGSTLTQQLVRNLSQFGLSREKKYSRKVREALIAVRLEQVYSKREILQLYLNNIYYGGGAHGIQAASKTFFGKPASKLTLAEAALLAGLPQRPSKFSPFENLDSAVRRRDEVLDSMRTYGYITAAECDQAKSEEPHLVPRQTKRTFNFKSPYFVTYILSLLSKRYGTEFVYSGLKVETTLNWKMQKLAEQTLENGLKNGADYGTNQGAMVSIDPNTGYIRTMVGGRNFHADQFNIVTQGRRQPGSTFKVFDYSAAFDTGTAELYTTYTDKPIPYPNDPLERVVHNYDGGYSYNNISCLDAIRFSKNTIAVQVAQAVGIKTVIQYAQKMGITTKLQPYLPTALGASEVHPLDLCSAYTVFPTKGTRYKPMPIIRITDSEGNLVEDHAPEGQSDILKPHTIEQMETALEAVVTSGSGTKARGTEANGIIEHAHGKTGTTSDFRDAWFAGYTPELTTVIWVGNVHRNKAGHKVYEPMPSAAGGILCAPIWHDFMIQALPIQHQFHLIEQVASTAPSQTIEIKDTIEDQKPRHKRVKKLVPVGTKDGIRPATDDPNAPPATGTPDSAEALDGQTAQTDSAAAPTTSEPRTAPEITGDAADNTPSTTPVAPQRSGNDPDLTAGGGLRVSVPAVSQNHTSPARSERHAGKGPAAQMTTVRVCVDSGGLATEWCEATRSMRVTVRQAARMRPCPIHHAPPGE